MPSAGDSPLLLGGGRRCLLSGVVRPPDGRARQQRVSALPTEP